MPLRAVPYPMKKLFGVLIATLALGLLALFLILTRDKRSRAEEDAHGASPSKKQAATTEDALLSPAATALDAPAPTPPSIREEVATALEQRRSFDVEGARWIDGRVEIPSIAPADETLRVLALEHALGPREIYGDEGILRKLLEPGDSMPAGVLAVERVGSDGRFRLPFPADKSEGWIALDGRFLYLLECVRAEPGAGGAVTLVPKLGGCIAGEIVLPQGIEDTAKTLGEIEIELGLDRNQFAMSDSWSAWLFDRGAKADSSGRFELRAIDPLRPHSIEIRSSELADVSRDGLEVQAGQVLELEFALGFGATARGRVLDPEGHPSAGAKVVAVTRLFWGFPGDPRAETVSGEDGGFELKGIPPGRCWLIARNPGFLSSEKEAIEVPEGGAVDGVELRLEDGQAIAGIVRTPEGDPVAGAEVKAEFDPEALVGMTAFTATRGAEGESKTDSEGRFRVAGLGVGPFVVKASAPAPEGSRGGTWKAQVSAVRPDTPELELILQPPSEIRGRVVDQDGAPIPAFTVLLHAPAEVFFMPGERRTEDVKNEKGEFLLKDLDAGTWEIDARAKGLQSVGSVAVTLPSTTPLDPIEIRLAPEAAIAGKVLAPDETPIVGAKVTLQVDVTKRFAKLTGELDLPETYSNRDGSFHLSPLGQGTPALLATHSDFAPSEPVNVEVRAGEITKDVVLTLRKGGTLTGLVYNREGDPLPAGQIILQEPTLSETTMGRTLDDGTFRFERLRPGTYTVTAMLEDLSSATGSDDEQDFSTFFEKMRFATVAINDGEEAHVVLGEPPADPVTVTGKITHAGDPVNGGIVNFLPDGGEGLQAMKMTDVKEGRYETRLDKPGRYLVSVQVLDESGTQQNSVEFTERIPEAESHVLDLELPLGRISGQVLGPEGDPLEGARVTLSHDGGIAMGSFLGGQYAELRSDTGGHYSFDYVRPGTYSVAAGGAFFGGAFGSRSEVGRAIQSGIRVGENELVDGIDFRLRSAGELSGIVRSPTGAPVPSASVFVRDEGGRLLERFSMTATGADGSFHYSGLAGGSYLVSARVSGLATAEEAQVRVSDGKTTEGIELVLSAATTLLVEVVDEQGEPVSATVSVRDDDGREMTGMIGWAEMMGEMTEGIQLDVQRVGPLPPGNYTVTAQAADGRSTKKPVNLDGASERKLKLRLK